MRSGKPRRTAQFVAYNRALGSLAQQVPGFPDPLAIALLLDNWKASFERWFQTGPLNPPDPSTNLSSPLSAFAATMSFNMFY